MVELGYAERVSHETVRKVLKKTNRDREPIYSRCHIHIIGPCDRYPALPGSRPNDGASSPGFPVYWSVLVW